MPSKLSDKEISEIEEACRELDGDIAEVSRRLARSYNTIDLYCPPDIERNGNRGGRRKPLSEGQKDEIWEVFERTGSITETARELNHPYSTVGNIVDSPEIYENSEGLEGTL
ncbi:hypothetical protein CMO88_02660 [Candidatus Woesearchaeota archaeon]|nr:hypothetical protein [Candidatus Woesearchaeota archaeon]|tara:strand:+ start:670 stop:1005 length:336 start_codon:yes stop_codon:yes gene_type:complete